MILTDEDLTYLNLVVYNADQEKIVNINVPVPRLEERIELPSGLNVEIVDLIDDNRTGFQGIAVAPVVNDVVLLNEIIVVAAGTDSSEIMIDVMSARRQGRGYFLSGEIHHEDAWMEGQRDVAKSFVEQVNSVDGKTVMHLSGYSQSAYMLDIGGQLGIPTTVFNGWLTYNTLSKEAREFIKDNPGLFINYRHSSDNVTVILDGNIEKNNDFGTIVWFDGGSHYLVDWMFDSDGNIIGSLDDSKKRNGRSQQINNKIAVSMFSLNLVRDRLTASGGGLSASEEIYLDSTLALITIDNASRIINEGLSSIISMYQQVIIDLGKVWTDGLSHAENIVTVIDEYEIINQLELAGVTYESIVAQPTNFCNEKIEKANQIKSSFKTVVAEITTGIDQLVKNDQELSTQLGQVN